ncbi:unnamed protein product, partial [Nesidiocoris tenuis]
MARYSQRPENALKRANEFIDVGKPSRALETLYEVFRNKKWAYTWSESLLEPIMFKYLDLCVELKKSIIAKEGLFQYRNMFQSVNVGSLENVIRGYLRMAEEKTESAREKSQQAVIDIDDLDNLATPESILLSAVSGEDAQDRSDRTILTPWVKFLWESYCQCLELLRTNAHCETLYHDIARMEAYKAIEDIHGLMNMSKKPPISKTMANYYQKLAMVFWKAGYYLFHAAALFKLFQLSKDMRKNITHDELQRMACCVLLATLSIPLPSAHPEFDRFIETDKSPLEKAQRLATLLTLQQPPTRASLIRDLVGNLFHPSGTFEIRIDHGSGCVHFGLDLSESPRETAQDGPILQSMPSDQLRTQLINMANVLNEALHIINPNINRGSKDEVRTQLVRHYKEHMYKDHQRILERHKIIEDRKEYLEKLNTVREEEEQRRAEELARQQAQIEERRLQQEREERERKRQENEIQQIKDRNLKEKMQQISQTAHGQKMLRKLDEEEIKKLDAEQIALKEAEELQKEKREMQQKLKSQEKKIDYYERAKRLEEIPLLQKSFAERQNTRNSSLKRKPSVWLKGRQLVTLKGKPLGSKRRSAERKRKRSSGSKKKGRRRRRKRPFVKLRRPKKKGQALFLYLVSVFFVEKLYIWNQQIRCFGSCRKKMEVLNRQAEIQRKREEEAAKSQMEKEKQLLAASAKSSAADKGIWRPKALRDRDGTSGERGDRGERNERAPASESWRKGGQPDKDDDRDDRDREKSAFAPRRDEDRGSWRRGGGADDDRGFSRRDDDRPRRDDDRPRRDDDRPRRDDDRPRRDDRPPRRDDERGPRRDDDRAIRRDDGDRQTRREDMDRPRRDDGDRPSRREDDSYFQRKMPPGRRDERFSNRSGFGERDRPRDSGPPSSGSWRSGPGPQESEKEPEREPPRRPPPASTEEKKEWRKDPPKPAPAPERSEWPVFIARPQTAGSLLCRTDVHDGPEPAGHMRGQHSDDIGRKPFCASSGSGNILKNSPSVDQRFPLASNAESKATTATRRTKEEATGKPLAWYTGSTAIN